MKVTRSYWLGLGSGLILSSMLALLLSPQMRQGQAVTPQEPSSVSPVKQQANPQQSLPAQSSSAIQPSQNAPASAKIGRPFVVPDGSTAGQIADLLLAQGFISNKANFLENVHQKGVESRFRAGNFSLSPGLTVDELINRLLKST